jgi:hypothetical protein
MAGKRAQMVRDAGAFVWCAKVFLIGEKTIFEKKVLDLNRACHMVMESRQSGPTKNKHTNR